MSRLIHFKQPEKKKSPGLLLQKSTYEFFFPYRMIQRRAEERESERVRDFGFLDTRVGDKLDMVLGRDPFKNEGGKVTSCCGNNHAIHFF